MVRACFGTTKYCNAFLKGVPCNNMDCLYLHAVGEPSKPTLLNSETILLVWVRVNHDSGDVSAATYWPIDQERDRLIRAAEDADSFTKEQMLSGDAATQFVSLTHPPAVKQRQALAAAAGAVHSATASSSISHAIAPPAPGQGALQRSATLPISRAGPPPGGDAGASAGPGLSSSPADGGATWAKVSALAAAQAAPSAAAVAPPTAAAQQLPSRLPADQEWPSLGGPAAGGDTPGTPARTGDVAVAGGALGGKPGGETMAAQLARAKSAPSGPAGAALTRSLSGKKLAATTSPGQRTWAAGKTLVPPPPPPGASAAAAAAAGKAPDATQQLTLPLPSKREAKVAVATAPVKSAEPAKPADAARVKVAAEAPAAADKLGCTAVKLVQPAAAAAAKPAATAGEAEVPAPAVPAAASAAAALVSTPAPAVVQLPAVDSAPLAAHSQPQLAPRPKPLGPPPGFGPIARKTPPPGFEALLASMQRLGSSSLVGHPSSAAAQPMPPGGSSLGSYGPLAPMPDLPTSSYAQPQPQGGGLPGGLAGCPPAPEASASSRRQSRFSFAREAEEAAAAAAAASALQQGSGSSLLASLNGAADTSAPSAVSASCSRRA